MSRKILKSVMETMFDTLSQLPLLQGLAREDFTQILAKVKLSFVKYYSGDVITKAGNPSRQLIYILKGKYAIDTTSSDGEFNFIEEWQTPTLLFPQSLFGMNTCYPANCIALEETHVVAISKEDVLNELFNYEIFRLNYMNILSNRSQMYLQKLWVFAYGSIEQRFFNLIFSLSEKPIGKKILKINMNHLGKLINTTRLNVSHTLNDLQNQGLINLRRGEIIIPALEEVETYLRTNFPEFQL